MGTPMAGESWAAAALNTHPYTVRKLHEDYISAGVDVITTNTYASARHNLEPMGWGDLTAELNIRAVYLAIEARERVAKDRTVYIAGSISNAGILGGDDAHPSMLERFPTRSEITGDQIRANLQEQAQILAEAGVDFLVAESTGGLEHRKWVSEACRATGLPFWVGFKCRRDDSDSTVKVGYVSDIPLSQALDEVIPIGGQVINLFHSPADDITSALPVVKEHWSGALGAYPEGGRADYNARSRDPGEKTNVTPEEFVSLTQDWVQMGVQIIGGCCGLGVDYIRLLRDRLPRRVP